MAAERCGQLMSRVAAVCGRIDGHSGHHASEKAIESSRRWTQENPEKAREIQARSNAKCLDARKESRRKYYRRMTAQVDAARAELVIKQGGICPCGDPLVDDIVVDHDHSCCPCRAAEACGNCYRAAMHRKCNSAIGLLADDPRKLKLLADYLGRAA